MVLYFVSEKLNPLTHQNHLLARQSSTTHPKKPCHYSSDLEAEPALHWVSSTQTQCYVHVSEKLHRLPDTRTLTPHTAGEDDIMLSPSSSALEDYILMESHPF